MIVDPDFPDHWKTKMLVNLLDDHAAGIYVLRLWAHCQNRKQARFQNLQSEALKALCHFPGQANKLESSLVASGFIRRLDSGDLEVCNWADYNAALIAAWENGRKGGRPPTETDGKPTGNPRRTEKRREDKSREEKSREPPTPFAKADVDAICRHYLGYHATARPGSKERDLIAARLREGYSVADLCAAIDGNHRSPWHNGTDPKNLSGTKYHKLRLIFHDSDQVQMFMEIPQHAGPVLSEKTRRTVSAAQSWLERKEREDANARQATLLAGDGGNGECISSGGRRTDAGGLLGGPA